MAPQIDESGRVRTTDAYEAGRVLALDIETVSQGERADQYLESVKKYKAPSNYKDQEKIDAYIAAEKKKDAAKHGLHCKTGRIVSVAIVDCWGDEEVCFKSHDEVEILLKLKDYLTPRDKVIGKSSKDFDFGFIVGRYLANLMTPPNTFKQRNLQYEVDDFFGFSKSSSQRGSLADYAYLIGHKQKTMDGSGVQELYNSIVFAESTGDTASANAGWKQLEEYNLNDARIVRALTVLYYGRERGGI